MSEPARTISLNLFNAAPAEVRADTAPGATTLWPPGGVEGVGAPQGDESDYVAEIFDSVRPFGEGVEAVRRVAWAANDRVSPCYGHLLVDGGDTLKVAKEFEFGRAEFELLLAANRFVPNGHYDVVAFGLRGARLRGADKAEQVERFALEDARPDHVHFQCVIGFYFRAQGKFSAYTASSVPWHEYMAAGKLDYNLLPTGCYIYKRGEHRPAHADRWVIPALRLSDAQGSESGLVTVLRTHGHPGFDIESAWSMSTPSDNIHCAYSDAKFSSLGCQTVKGTMNDGLWANFQATLKTLPAGARVDYALFTGAEASIAWSLLQGGAKSTEAEILRRLGRLKAGSEGEEVGRLQAAMGVPVTGYLGASTRKKLAEIQALRGLAADGVFSPDMDARLEWRVFAGSAAAVTPSAAVAPAAVETARATATAVAPVAAVAPASGEGPVAAAPPTKTVPLPMITRQLISKIAPRPKNPAQAAIWDSYTNAITSPEGAAVLASYGIDTPQRQVFILANMMAETGGLSLIWESMNYSADRLLQVFPAAGISRAEADAIAHKPEQVAERVYGILRPAKAKELGNKQPGDGFRYRGGGFLQTTGRDNYRTLGQRIGEDLEGHPEKIEDGIVSLKAACAEWQRCGLNEHADRGSFHACCKGINLGNVRAKRDPEGMDQRLRYLQRALDAFGLPPPKRAPGVLEQAQDNALELGDMGEDVAAIQGELNMLGYPVGKPDGLFTTRTRDAVLEFQARNGLTITGRVDATTRAALRSSEAIEKDPEVGEPQTQAKPAPSRKKVASGRGRTGGSNGLAIVGIAVLGLLAMLAASGVFGKQVTEMPVIRAFASGWFEPLAFGGWLFAMATGLQRFFFRR